MHDDWSQALVLKGVIAIPHGEECGEANEFRARWSEVES